MFKYIKAFFKGLYKIVLAYPKIRKYAKNKDKYPIEERYAYARKLIKILVEAFDVEVNTEGLEKLDNNDTYLFVCNHQGFMDSLIFVYLFEKPLSFVAKIESRKYPIVGKVIYFIDTIFIDRDNIRDAVKMIKTSSQRLNEGKNVVIFPEGTRTKDVNKVPGEFKAGALKTVYETNKKIASFAIDGSYKVFSKKHKNGIKVQFKLIDIIDYENYKDKKTTELAKEIETATIQTVIEMSKQ